MSGGTWQFRPLIENQYWVQCNAVSNGELQNALLTLQDRLHGAWKGAGFCDGKPVLKADGSYQREHFSLGNNLLQGTWTIRWARVPLSI